MKSSTADSPSFFRLQQRQLRYLLQNGCRASAAGADACATAVIDQYRANRLTYHNLHHVQRTLLFVEQWRHLAENLNELRLALWFHDVIYDGRRVDNEPRSAQMAGDWLTRLHQPPETVARVHALIILTDHKRPPHVGDPFPITDGRLIIDADLCSLADTAALYDDHSQAIRREYGWVSDKDFANGRSRVLRMFLDRPFIFQHPAVRNRLETAARANIQRELIKLQADAQRMENDE